MIDIEIVGLVLAVEVITAVDVTTRAGIFLVTQSGEEEVVPDLVLDRILALVPRRILAPVPKTVTNASLK